MTRTTRTTRAVVFSGGICDTVGLTNSHRAASGPRNLANTAAARGSKRCRETARGHTGAGHDGGRWGSRGARAGASSLERDLKDLERLLKADASNGAGNVGAGATSIKQQLRSALRKPHGSLLQPAERCARQPARRAFRRGASFHRPTLAPPRARRLPFSALRRRPARSNKRPAPSDAQRTSGRCDRSSACSRWRFRNTQRSSRGAARSAFARSPISSRSSRARA